MASTRKTLDELKVERAEMEKEQAELQAQIQNAELSLVQGMPNLEAATATLASKKAQLSKTQAENEALKDQLN